MVSPMENHPTLKYLLSCNEMPSKIETSLINTALAGLDNHVDGFHSQVEKYASPLSPIRRVPPEIWAEIFYHSPDNIFSLSQVCRCWRRAALHTPRLWTTIMVDLFNDSEASQFESNVLEEWMGRSGALGIDVALFYDQLVVEPGSTSAGLNSHLRSLPQKHRWKSLYLGPRCIRALFESESNRWGMLEELIIESSRQFHDPLNHSPPLRAAIPSSPTIGPASPPPLSLLSLHALQRLTINVCDGYSSRTLFVPWHQLTYLHLNSHTCTTFDYIDILRRCPALVTCILCLGFCFENDTRSALPPIRITLPYLTSLVLTGADSMSSMLDHLRLPSLRYLYLATRRSVWHTNSGWDATSPSEHTGLDMATMVKSSGCALRRLELHTISMREADVEVCFDALESLEELRITHAGVRPLLSGSILNRMADEVRGVAGGFKTDKVLLPRLKKLDVMVAKSRLYGGREIPKELVDGFEDLVKARAALYEHFGTVPSHVKVSKLDDAKLTGGSTEVFNFMSEGITDLLSSFTKLLEDHEVRLEVPYR